MSFSYAEQHLFMFNSNKTLLGRLSATCEMIQFKYAKSYLPNSQALAINRKHQWKDIFREQGVSDNVIQSVSWAILRDV